MHIVKTIHIITFLRNWKKSKVVPKRLVLNYNSNYLLLIAENPVPLSEIS